MKKFGRIVLFLLFSFSLSNSICFSQPAKKLSLADCIEIALENNTSIVSAQSYSKMAEAGLKSAWGRFMPSINTSAYWQRDDQKSYRFRIDDFLLSDDYYRYGLSLEQPIFTGFRNYANLKLNKAENERETNNFHLTKQRVILDVKLNYYNVLKAKQLLTIAEETLRTSEDELSRIEAMEKIGVSSRAEVYQQKVRVGENKLSVIQKRNDLINAQTQLNHVLGIDVRTQFDLVPESTDFDIEANKFDIDKEIQDALKNRFDYKAALNTLQSRKSNITIQKSNYFPSVYLGADYNWSDYQLPNSKSNITDFDSYSFNLNIRMNIFNGFQDNANVNIAKAEFVSAEADLEQKKRQVILEVKQALLEIERAEENLEVTNENVVSAEEDFRLASERYRIGAGTLLDQNVAHTALTSARVNRIRAIYDYKYALAVLDLATGNLSW